MLRLTAFALLAAACGGPSAEAPLTVRLGVGRAATAQALRDHQFCAPNGQADGDQVVFPRCDRTNAERGDAWVTATFDHDRLIELRRWERYGDAASALARWNALVAARLELGPESEDARRALQLAPGTRALEAFRAADGSVVGVFLLDPSPPEQANILEQIVRPVHPK